MQVHREVRTPICIRCLSFRDQVPGYVYIPIQPLRDLRTQPVGMEVFAKTSHRYSGLLSVKLDLLEWLRQQLPSKQFFFGGRSSFSASEAEADEMASGVQKWNVFPDVDAYLESQAAGEKRFPPLGNTIFHVPDHASEFDLQALMKILLQFIGENIGLTRFDACCERLVSSSIKIHQKMASASKTAISLASSNSSRHRTDIVLKLGGRPFCVVEMKLPVFFRKNMNDGHPDLVDIISESLENRDASNHLFHGVLQLWNYFVKLDLGFGVLSSVDLSYLVRREGNTLLISDSIQWEDTRLIGAFAYLIYMASSAEPNHFKKEGAHGAFFCVESASGSDMGDASAHVGGKRGTTQMVVVVVVVRETSRKLAQLACVCGTERWFLVASIPL